MNQPRIEQWPSSEIETLDREIGARARRLSDGTATAAEISELTRLIRERADRMMPGILRRRRLRRAEKQVGRK